MTPPEPATLLRFDRPGDEPLVFRSPAEVIRADVLEDVIPALETAHAVSYALKLAGEMSENEIIVVNLSGRGDKDVTEAMRVMKMQEESREQN